MEVLPDLLVWNFYLISWCRNFTWSPDVEILPDLSVWKFYMISRCGNFTWSRSVEVLRDLLVWKFYLISWCGKFTLYLDAEILPDLLMWNFYLISCCESFTRSPGAEILTDLSLRNFVEMHNFHRISGKSIETLRKQCVCTNLHGNKLGKISVSYAVEFVKIMLIIFLFETMIIIIIMFYNVIIITETDSIWIIDIFVIHTFLWKSALIFQDPEHSKRFSFPGFNFQFQFSIWKSMESTIMNISKFSSNSNKKKESLFKFIAENS